MNNPHRTRVRALYLYHNAVERGDFETVAKILRQAEGDALLEQMILGLELDADIPAEQAETVSRSVHQSNGIEQIITVRRPSQNGQTLNPTNHRRTRICTRQQHKNLNNSFPVRVRPACAG
ncbi:MAG: hypothetical protein R3E39_15510 [Anaerolineae bacterium]